MTAGSVTKFPNVFKHESSREYFKEFFALNSEQENNDQSFAKTLKMRLGWKKSFVSDLKSERRSIQVHHAIEFAELARMDVYETERLMFLVINDDAESVVKGYFKEKMERAHDSRPPLKRPSDKLFNTKTFKGSLAPEIVGTLSWLKKRITNKEFTSLLYLFECSEAEVEKSLFDLERNGTIRINDDKSVEILERDLFNSQLEYSDEWDGSYEEYIEAYIERQMSLCLKFIDIKDDQNNALSHFKSDLAIIRFSDIDALSDKLQQFNSWLSQIGEETERTNMESSLHFKFWSNLVQIHKGLPDQS